MSVFLLGLFFRHNFIVIRIWVIVTPNIEKDFMGITTSTSVSASPSFCTTLILNTKAWKGLTHENWAAGLIVLVCQCMSVLLANGLLGHTLLLCVCVSVCVNMFMCTIPEDLF